MGTAPGTVKPGDTSDAAPARSIEVAHVISGDLWAGAEVATFHLVNALARREDVRVSVVALNEGTLTARWRERGVRVAVIPESQTRFRTLVRRVRAQLAGCDLVHSHRYKEDLLAALSGRPWVATRHGRPEPVAGRERWRMAVYQALDRMAVGRSARGVVAVSGEVEEWLRRRVPAVRIERIWNGIADPRAAVGDRPIPWAERPRCVGVLGRLAPVKGYELAVEAVARCPDVVLEIVGDGPERGRLESLARSLGATDRIRFLGHLDAPLGRVARWRALLVTSLHEGNPVGVLEAMGLGTPVLSGPLRGVQEVLAGSGGRIVGEGRHAPEWAEAIARLIDDAEAGPVLSRAARQRFLDAFLDERCADRMAALYRAVLAGAG